MSFLSDFLELPNSAFRWEADTISGLTILRVTTQEWKNGEWSHDVVLCFPKVRTGSTWLLHITGGDPNDTDISWSQEFADRSGHPVATLFHMPNQPIWERSEDDLIAHTFEQFLDTGDPTWPLLFPMVRSAQSCMDAVEEFVGSDQKFVAFGASKRGWTSWLLASSGDPRLVGIAPMMFDDLRMTLQLEKQWRDWGHLSPMIADYSSRDLHESVETELGQALVAMVDPATYLSDIEIPVLIINGACDPYWTVDACSLYWDDIRSEKWLVTIPNLGHSFFPSEYWAPTLIAFLKQVESGKWEEQEPISTVTWYAGSADRHFDAALWSTESPNLDIPFVASFVANEYRAGDIPFWRSSLVRVDRQNSST